MEKTRAGPLDAESKPCSETPTRTTKPLPEQRRGSRWLLRFGAVVQVAIAAAVAVGVWMGWGSLDSSFRRGVVAASSQSSQGWAAAFDSLCAVLKPEELARLMKEDRGLKHSLSPDVAVDVVFTRPSDSLPQEAWRRQAVEALKNGHEDWWQFVDNRIEGGLRYASVVKWSQDCGGCHEPIQPQTVAGWISFVHPTPRMSQILRYRRLDLLLRQGISFAVFASALWLVLAIAIRQTRRAEAQIASLFEEVSTSEQRYRTLVDNALVGVYLIQDDRFLFVNRRACEVIGYTIDEALSTVRVADIVAPEDREMVARRVRQRLSGQQEADHYEFTGLRKDGSRIPIEVFGSRVMLPSGPAIEGMFMDNSERRASEQALDAAYRAVVGLPGQNIFAAAAESLASLLQVQMVLVCRLVGDEIEILASHSAIPTGTRVGLAGRPDQQVVLHREPVSISQGLREDYPACAEWAGFALQSYFGWPLIGSDGAISGVLGVLDTQARELTEVQRRILEMHAVRLGRELERQRQEERARELEQRLLESQKLEALGVLAGGIAHDFNNVLAGIAGTAEVLLRTLPPGPNRGRVESILQLSYRGGEVVSKILAFARSEVPTAQAVDLNAVVSDALTLASHSIGPQIRLESCLDPSLPSVDGDAAQLQQVTVNLLLNARDAMPGGGRVVVRTRTSDEGKGVVLEIEDEGRGIAPEVLPHIFEPFFTTKPSGHGTGLGLSIVYRAVTSHGGSVKVDSIPGAHTRVTVTLPRGRLRGLPLTQAVTPAQSAAPSVLLVEDEEVIAQSMGELLTIEGYRVLVAQNGRDAIDLWDREGGRIDVVLLDISMPGMSGVELAQELRERNPKLPVIFSSGHSSQALGEQFLGPPSVAFLQKPYGAGELLRTLHRILGGSQ